MSAQIPAKHREYRLPTRNGFDSLALQEAATPKPGKGEVLVRIRAVSLNFRDLIISKGSYPLPMRDNVVPGSDGAGEVVAVGEGVDDWKVGDRVAGNFTQLQIDGDVRDEKTLKSALGGGWDGVLTEYKVFPDFGIVRIPDHLSFEEASTLPCAALTAYNTLYGSASHKLHPGQWVLAHGTGGVSVFALQLAISGGANVVITSSSDEKLARVKALAGPLADRVHTVNYKKTPEIEKEVLKLTNGLGVDFVVEVGGAATLAASFGSLRLGGMIGAIGFVGGAPDKPVPDVNGLALTKAATLRGILIGSRRQFEEMVQHVQTTGFKPLVDKVFSFEQLKEAYEYQWSQKHVGKVVVKVA